MVQIQVCNIWEKLSRWFGNLGFDFLNLRLFQSEGVGGRGDGEKNPAAAGWLGWAGGRLKFRGHLRREENLRQNRNPRRSTVRMCKECLMCILCPCSLFSALTAEKISSVNPGFA